MVALSAARAAGLDSDEDSWNLQRSLVNRLAETWREPDHGLWEIRGPQRHFTHSRVMVWAAFDRAVRAVEVEGMEGPVDRWREARDEVCEELMTRGFDAERNTFTQHYDTREVDASLLVLPLVGFIKGDDPKMLGTIEAIEKDLMREGLLMRYRTETDVDGQNQRRACVATRGIPPERCECDGALVACQRIPVRPRADSGSPKTRHIRVARKTRDSEHQVF